jgi:hypothetical protein
MPPNRRHSKAPAKLSQDIHSFPTTSNQQFTSTSATADSNFSIIYAQIKQEFINPDNGQQFKTKNTTDRPVNEEPAGNVANRRRECQNCNQVNLVRTYEMYG